MPRLQAGRGGAWRGGAWRGGPGRPGHGAPKLSWPGPGHPARPLIHSSSSFLSLRRAAQPPVFELKQAAAAFFMHLKGLCARELGRAGPGQSGCGKCTLENVYEACIASGARLLIHRTGREGVATSIMKSLEKNNNNKQFEYQVEIKAKGNES